VLDDLSKPTDNLRFSSHGDGSFAFIFTSSGTLVAYADTTQIGGPKSAGTIVLAADYPSHVAAGTVRALSALRLSVTPSPARLGEALTVALRGAAPWQEFWFVSWPVPAADFGGGIIGAHRAGDRGTIRFRSPAVTMSTDVGRWQINALVAAGHILTVCGSTIWASSRSRVKSGDSSRGQGDRLFRWIR